MNVVDAALVEADGVTTPKNTVTALMVLAAEVRQYRQFLADLGSIVAGMPVEPCEALRRVEELVRLRETSGDSTLAAEVRRLRAAVEAVQLMPRYDISTTQVGSSMEPDSFGDWVKYDDVLAALEGE